MLPTCPLPPGRTIRRWVLTANLGNLLIGASKTFTGFSEDLPSAGSTVCTSGAYARNHNPWVDFSNVPSASNQPFTSFPTNFTTLPTISFVIPNLNDDMHDGRRRRWHKQQPYSYNLLRNAGQARSVWRDHCPL